MGEMETAERKNEARLRKKYRAGRLDENDNFSYPDENGQYDYKQDEENKTDGASIMVWRAKIKNNRVTIGRVQETVLQPARLDRRGRTLTYIIEDTRPNGKRNPISAATHFTERLCLRQHYELGKRVRGTATRNLIRSLLWHHSRGARKLPNGKS